MMYILMFLSPCCVHQCKIGLLPFALYFLMKFPTLIKKYQSVRAMFVLGELSLVTEDGNTSYACRTLEVFDYV